MPYAKWIRCFLAALIDRNVVARVVAKRHGGNGPLLEALDTVIRPA